VEAFQELIIKRIESLESTLAQKDKRVQSLEVQVAELRGIRVAQPKTDKPVNRPAYEKALDALMKGDRVPMRTYRKFYRIPT
jgi:hypothetical protein